MKKVKLAIIIFFVFSLTGCIQKYTLTDKQGDAAVEYMAGLVLKYDKNYNQRLLINDKKQEELDIITKAAEKSNVINNDVDIIPSVAASTESDTNNSVTMNENSATPTQGGQEADTNIVTVEKSNATLSEVIGKNDFEIEYLNYKLHNSYPENSDETSFSLDPGKGNQLLVVSFSVKNLSNETKNFNLINSKIVYKLDINDGITYKPLLTLLENDLRYIDKKFGAGKANDLVLVFEVSEKTNISDINLIVSRGSKTNIIELK